MPGCYDVSASVSVEGSGPGGSFTAATCGTGPSAQGLGGSTVNCSGTYSPLCPIGAYTPVGTSAPGTSCTTADPTGTRGSQMTVSINPGAPRSYLITFTGYTPLLASCTAGVGGAPTATLSGTFGTRGTCTTSAAGAATTTTGPACPAGFAFISGPFNVNFSPSGGATPIGFETAAPDGVCQFNVSAEKKFIEITHVTLTPTSGCSFFNSTTGVLSPANLIFSEGFKSFFGPSCPLTVSASGIVILKSGVNCSDGSEPATGSSAAAPAADFPAGSTYQCTGDTLSVLIPDIGSFGGTVPVTVTGSGSVGVFGTIPSPSLGSTVGGTGTTLCTGSSAPAGGVTTTLGGTVFVCPSGTGAGAAQACVASFVDVQPSACATLNFTFVLPNAQRVVPYVRWAGEKQVLTKCFGGAGLFGGALVEFTLEGGGASAQAALIPASGGTATGATAGATGGGVPVATPSQNTVITTTDPDGCATVIVYAASEGVVNVDAAIYSTSPATSTVTGGVGGTTFTSSTTPILNEHAFEIFYLKFDHINVENIAPAPLAATANPLTALGFLAAPAGIASLTLQAPCTTLGTGCALPSAPGANPPNAAGVYAIPLCGNDYLRALVHGYFEMPGDPSGRPAQTVSPGGYPGSTTGGVGYGSYTLPAGRWVLPEDWPVLATFAGFTGTTPVGANLPSSVYQWDLNSGWVFNPAGENPVICAGPSTATTTATQLSFTNVANNGPISNSQAGGVSYGPCYGKDAAGTVYATAPTPATTTSPGCPDGVTVGIGPFDITQTCTSPGPLTYAPAGGTIISQPVAGTFAFGPLSSNSTYLPNGTLNQFDAPMPPAQVTFSITSGPGFFNEVNKTGLYRLNTVDANGNVNGAIYPDPFYAEAIPASPLIPPITNNGGYLWDTYGFRGGSVFGATTSAGTIAGLSTSATLFTPTATAAPCSETTTGPDNVAPVLLGATAGQGFTYVTAAGAAAASTALNGAPAACYVGAPRSHTPSLAVTALECSAIGGHFLGTSAPGAAATGACYVTTPPTTVPGGKTLTNFGSACPATVGGVRFPSSPTTNASRAATTSVEVADITGFAAGQPVTVYSETTGATLVTGLTITSVTPGPDTLFTGAAGTSPTTPNTSDVTAGAPGTITFSGAVPGCVSIYQGVVASDVVAVTLPAGATAPAAGAEVDITTPTGGTVSTFAAAAGVPCASTAAGAAGGTTVCLTGAGAIAAALSGCTLGAFAAGTATCSIGAVLPAGTILSGAPTVGTVPIRNAAPLFGTGQGPYPFWQWLTPGGGSASAPNAASVYSDNHGEAVVSLETGIQSNVAPTITNGVATCPTGYTLATTPDAQNNCLLSLSALGTTANAAGAAFSNVATANVFKAGSPGCITTGPAGTVVTSTTTSTSTTGTLTASVATTTTSSTSTLNGLAVGGPGPNQICINNLGGIEFGQGATLGATQVQAIADYPYDRLHAPISSGNISKVFTSAFNKNVTVSPVPGGVAGPAGTTSYTVNITGTDICGNPILGEPVNVYALSSNGGAVVLAPLGPGSSNGTNAATVFLSTGSGAFTNIAPGTASLSLEVLQSVLGNGGLVIKVVFPLERIERFVTVIGGSTGTPTSTQQLYPPGYNMVGGPAGTNFGVAEAVFSYSPTAGTYSPVSSTNISSNAPTCQGYFAYFASAAAVPIAVTSTAGQTVTCNLQAGWNLVGNPFGSAALLPAGVTAYHFNGTTYDLVSAIPLGGAVYIFEPAAATVTLTAT